MKNSNNLLKNIGVMALTFILTIGAVYGIKTFKALKLAETGVNTEITEQQSIIEEPQQVEVEEVVADPVDSIPPSLQQNMTEAMKNKARENASQRAEIQQDVDAMLDYVKQEAMYRKETNVKSKMLEVQQNLSNK